MLLLALGWMVATGANAIDFRSFPVGNQVVRAEDVSAEAPVLFRAMRFNEATGQWNVELVVTNRSERTFGSTLFLLVEGFANTTGPLTTDGVTLDAPVRPFVRIDESGLFLPGGSSRPRTIGLGFIEGAGAPRLQLRVFAVPVGPAYALGLTRSLNEAGQPLPQVQVTELGPLGDRVLSTDPEYGVVTLGQSAGEHLWIFEREGYLPVWRRETLLRGAVRLVPNPRLVRRNPVSVLVAAGGNTVVQDATGDLRLSFVLPQPGQQARVTLTTVEAQTLPGLLPQGWSPLRAFWVESTNLAVATAFSIRPPRPIAPTDIVALAKWNTDAASWEVQMPLAGNGTNVIEDGLQGWGAYALVVGDSGLLAPSPDLVPGAPLRPSAPPAQPFPTYVAGGSVNPGSSPASRTAGEVTAAASVLITNVTGLLPSGLTLRVEVTEDYRLQDASKRFLAVYETFITAYRQPAGTGPRVLAAAFPVRPQLLFGSDELAEATVRMEVLPPDIFRGTVFETAGGGLTSDRIRLHAVAGDFNTPQAAMIRELASTNLATLVIPGQSVVASFDLTVAALAPGRGLSLQVSNLAPNAQFVLARILSGLRFNGLEPVERLRTDAAGALTSLEPGGGERLPRLRSAGQYVLVQVGSPQGLITGTARDAQGRLASGMPVRITGQPWLTFSSSNGTYRLVAPVGSVQVVATDPGSGDAAFVDAAIADPGTALALDVGTIPRGPRVIAISPNHGAVNVPRVAPVEITFSEPVNPASLLSGAIQILGTNSSPVAAGLSLNQANTQATLLPVEPLAPDTVHTLRLSTNIADPTGLKLEGPSVFTFITESDRLNRTVGQVISHEPTNGLARMTGSAGTAEPESPVILVNETRGTTATVLSKVDGSFDNFIEADVDDFLSAVIQNANGTRNTIPVSRQLFRDGSVGLFNGGGILEAESDGGPVQVFVEPGAIATKTKFRLETFAAGELLALMNNTPPTNASVVGKGLQISLEGDALKSPMDISIPVTAAELQQAGLTNGVPAEESLFALVAPATLQGDPVYVLLDKLQFEDGKLVTRSPPFPGADALTEPADAVREALREAALQALVPHSPGAADTAVRSLAIAPLVLAERSQPGLLTGKVLEQVVNPTGTAVAGIRPLAGAVVTANAVGGFSQSRPGRLTPGSICCVSAANGSYAFMVPATAFGDPLNPNASGESLTVSASHPSRMDRVITVANTAVSIARFTDLIFPPRNLGPSQDPYPPRVTAFHQPVFPAPGEQVQVVVLATHGSDEPDVRLQAIGAEPATVNFAADVQITLLNSEVIGPTAVRSTFGVVCPTNAVITLKASGEVPVAPRGEIPYAINFTGDQPSVEDPLPSDNLDRSGPRVIYSVPREDLGQAAPALRPGEPLLIRFDEAVSKDLLSNPGAVRLNPNDGGLHLELSADQQALVVQAYGLRPETTYTLTLSPQITDIALARNPLDQNPSTPDPDSFVLRFRTAPMPKGVMEEIQSGGGAVLRGIYAYVLERQGSLDGSLVVYDLSVPQTPEKVAELSVPGFPRDLALIPAYSYARSTNLSVAPSTSDLLAVVGGKVGAAVDERGNLMEGFQYLWIIDIHDPLHPVRLASALVTTSPSAVVSKIQWSPPFLAYLETDADSQGISLVNLQSFILGGLITPDEFGETENPGRDLNGDGDFVDLGEALPIPSANRLSFAGKTEIFALEGNTQRIIDFDWRTDDRLLGVVLSAGKLLDLAGDPILDLPPGYLTLSKRFIRPPFVDAFWPITQGNPKRVHLLRDVESVDESGVPGLADLALVSVVGNDGTSRLDVIEITDPRSPRLRRSIPVPVRHGLVQSIIPREDGLLMLATSGDVLLLNPARLTEPLPAGGGVHASFVGLIPDAGSGARTFSGSLDGLQVVSLGGRSLVRQGPPHLDFVQVPTNTFAAFTNVVLGVTNVLHPRQVTNQARLVEALLDKLVRRESIQPAPFRTSDAITSRLTPPDPQAHYYVLVQAPGSAGETIELALEGLNESGHPLNNKRLGFPPVRAMSTQALAAIKQKPIPDFDAPIRTLTAYRLVADKGHPAYNIYLSRPFAVTCEGMTLADLQALQEESDREILWSGRYLQASLDFSMAPGSGQETGNPVVGPFAGSFDPSRSLILPGASVVADCYAADYIVGPNPPSPAGYALAPGSMSSVVLHNGEMRTETEDFSLPSRRMPIVFKRTLGAQDLFDGPFGRGWDFNYNQRLLSLDPAVFPGVCFCSTGMQGGGPETVPATRDVFFFTGAAQVLLYKFAGTNPPVEFANDPLAQQLGWFQSAAAFYHSPTGVFDMLVKFKDQKYARLMPDGQQYWYSAEGRLQAIYDRYSTNAHLLHYNDRGELARIEDKSVTTARYLEIGYYRNPEELIPPGSEDVHTTNRYAAGRIARLADFTEDDHPERDVWFEYSEKGELEVRKGIEVKTANLDGFTGQQQTRYRYGSGQNSGTPEERAEDYPLANGLSGIIGGDPSGAPLMAVVEFESGAPVPVTKRFEGANGPVALEIQYPNTAAELLAENGKVKVTTGEGGSTETSEMELDKFGLPSLTTLSGVGAPSLQYQSTRDEFGLPQENIFPMQNKVLFHYEPRPVNHRSKANIRRIETVPHGGGTSLSATFNFDDRYNFRSGIQTDADGNALIYSPTPDGLEIGRITHPARAVNVPPGSPGIPVGLGGVEDFSYNSHGQLTRHRDANGIVQQVQFNRPDGFPSAVIQGEGTPLTTTLQYEGLAGQLGHPSRSSPQLNAATDFQYDERERLLSRDRAGAKSTFSYDENGRVVRETSTVDANTEVETLRTYLHNGFLRTNIVRTVEVGPQQTLEELTTEYLPDSQFRVHRIRYPNGEERVIDQFDHLGRPHRVTLGAYVETYAYDNNNNLTSVTRGDATTTYSYDGFDRLETVSLPVGSSFETVTRRYFNSGGLREVEVRDAANNLNRKASFQIDALGRDVVITAESDAGPVTSLISYDGAQRIRQQASAEGDVSMVRYDDAGRPMDSSNSVQRVTYSHDANSNLERVVSSEGAGFGRVFTNSHTPFDQLDRSTRLADDEGIIAQFDLYRFDDRILEMRDGRGQLQESDYTRLGEPMRRTSPTGVEFRFAYDRNRQPALQGDRENKGWEFEYDDSLRLVEHRLRDDQPFGFLDFDTRNQPQTITFPGLSINLRYDNQGRKTNQVATYRGHTRSEGQGFDALDRPTANVFSASLGTRQVAGSMSYRYDLLGPTRRVTTTIDAGGGANSFVLQHDVRRDGLRTNVVYPSLTSVTELRDAAGRLLAVRPLSAAAVVNSTTFAAADLIEQQILGGNLIACENRFDGRKRLTHRRYTRQSDGRVLVELRYVYDANNNVVARQMVHRGGRADFFGYDEDNRLKRSDSGARLLITGAATRSVTGFTVPAELNAAPGAWAPGLFARNFQYDLGSGLDRLTNSAVVNPDNLSLPPFAISIEGFDESLHAGRVDGVTRGRDSLANTTNAVLRVRLPGNPTPSAVPASLQYDGLGQLVRLERSDGVVVDYEYLPGGLMGYRRVTGPAGLCVPSERIFVWDAGKLIEEYDLAGGQTSLRARYFYTDSDVPVAVDLRRGDALERCYYLPDVQGSMLGVADFQGALIERYSYDAWGQPEIEPADSQAPVVRRIVSDAAGLIIEFSERILPRLVLPSPSPDRGLVGAYLNPASGLAIEQSGTPVAGSFVVEERRTGFGFSTVIRFAPGAALSGNLVLRVDAGVVNDEWNNPVAVGNIPFAFNPAPGTTLFQNPVVTSGGGAGRTVSDQPFLFHGQYYDFEAGLVYMRARHYEPFSGRFLQPDPMGYEDSVNPYAAFVNNPQSMRDPSGEVAVNAVLAIIGAGVGAAGNVYLETQNNPGATTRDYLAKGLSGAFAGAMAGATFGASTLTEAVVLGAGGGVVSKLLDVGIGEGRIAGFDEVASSAAAGAAWGIGGAAAGKIVVGAVKMGGRVVVSAAKWGGEGLEAARARLGPAALKSADDVMRRVSPDAGSTTSVASGVPGAARDPLLRQFEEMGKVRGHSTAEKVFLRDSIGSGKGKEIAFGFFRNKDTGKVLPYYAEGGAKEVGSKEIVRAILTKGRTLNYEILSFFHTHPQTLDHMFSANIDRFGRYSGDVLLYRKAALGAHMLKFHPKAVVGVVGKQTRVSPIREFRNAPDPTQHAMDRILNSSQP